MFGVNDQLSYVNAAVFRERPDRAYHDIVFIGRFQYDAVVKFVFNLVQRLLQRRDIAAVYFGFALVC